MTVLIGFQGNGFSIIAADSRATDENGDAFILANPKVIKDNEEDYIFGIAGATRGGNLLHHGWIPPQPPQFQGIRKLDEFITQIFVPQLRDSFVEAGFDGKEDGFAAQMDSVFLVSVQGVIYPINSDYGWDRDIRGIYQFGTGGTYALAIMDALGIFKCRDNMKKAIKIMETAIAITCKYNAFCVEPIVVETQLSAKE